MPQHYKVGMRIVAPHELFTKSLLLAFIYTKQRIYIPKA